MQVRLGLTVEGEHCEVLAPIEKHPAAPVSTRSYKFTSTADILFEGGARLQAFGPLANFGGRYGPSFGMLLGVYPWRNHGIAFDLLGEGYGKSAVSDFEDRLDVPAKAQFSLSSFFLGYIFKYYLHPRFSFHYGLTGGLSALELTARGESARSKLLFGGRQRLRFDFVLADLGNLKFALSPSFYHYVLPHASFAGVEASGHSIGTSLGLLVTD